MIPQLKKGKGKQTQSEEEEHTQHKTFQELDEEDSMMEIDVPRSPNMRLGPVVKHKNLATQKRKGSESKQQAIATGELHDPPCGNCERAGFECLKEQGGGACVRCIKQKHKCDKSRARGGGKKSAKRNKIERVEVNAKLLTSIKIDIE